MLLFCCADDDAELPELMFSLFIVILLTVEIGGTFAANKCVAGGEKKNKKIHIQKFDIFVHLILNDIWGSWKIPGSYINDTTLEKPMFVPIRRIPAGNIVCGEHKR